MKPAPKFDENDPMHRLRLEMTSRNWGAKELAGAIGYTVGSVGVLMARRFDSRASQLILEDLFHVPIWTDRVEYGVRNRILYQELGPNPFAMSARKANALARRYALKASQGISRRHMVLLIADEMARRELQRLGIELIRERAKQGLKKEQEELCI